MKIPTWITDAAENVRVGMVAMWAGFSPVVRASILCTCVGFVLGFGFAAWVLP